MVMKKAYAKTVIRTVKSNFARFIAITAVVLLGVAFVTGLGALTPLHRNTISAYFTEAGGADLVVKTESETGFTESELNLLKDSEYTVDVQPLSAFDTASGAADVFAQDSDDEGLNARIYYMPLGEMKVNEPKIIEGRAPESQREILLDRMHSENCAYGVGDKLEMSLFGSFKTEFEVVGIIENPLYFTHRGEPDLINEEPLDVIIYMDSGVTELSITQVLPNGYVINMPLPVTDAYVRTSGTEGLNIFGDGYRNRIDECVNGLKSEIDGDLVYLTTDENYSIALTDNYAEKIHVIALIFPMFFIAVAALVVLTTMTRLVEEERSVIGCYKTLGYGNGRIALKYIGFSLVCCILGSVVGLFLGEWILPSAVFPAFEGYFFFPEVVNEMHVTMGVICACVMAAVVALITAYTVLRDLKHCPAELLRPKAPKAGKKIFLEHVSFIWNRMKFRDKSTYRNIFRYVGHLLMTVISVAGSTALVLAGLGLHDVSQGVDAGDFAGFVDTVSLVSFVIILFAAALCVLVIYNLTNMNIGERKREIATLKVLGYHNIEVSMYIYREVLVMAIFGIILGLPLGFALLYFVFGYLEFGSASMVKWYSYLLTVGLVLVFVVCVDLLLHRKIRNIDMNDSLKILE